jgi:hypothetical protein
MIRDFDKKAVVESCLILDTSTWKRAGILRPGMLCGGYWHWPGALTLGYVLDTRDLGKAMLGLLEPTSQAGVFIATRIPLDTTSAPKGGVRLWWCCPECSRRSGKLFQPPGASHFACRGCHGLTYTSTQQNHCHDCLHAMLAARVPGTTPAHWHTERMPVYRDLRLLAAGHPG